MQNLKHAAIAQDQLAWYEEMVADPKALVKVATNHKAECPPVGAKKRRAPSSILRCIEEVMQEQHVLYDGVHEMMTLPHYMHWMPKAKNGSMDPQAAAAKWNLLSGRP